MNLFILNVLIYSKRMGLHESGETDLDVLLLGGPDIDSTEPEEILCQCGRGRGLPRMVPRLPQAAILHRISLMEVNTSLYPAFVCFDLILNVPVNNLSVTSGGVFLG